jgi:hypothetical protein
VRQDGEVGVSVSGEARRSARVIDANQYLAGHSNPRTTQITIAGAGESHAISSSGSQFETTSGGADRRKSESLNYVPDHRHYEPIC